jgi:hypothetical protein
MRRRRLGVLAGIVLAWCSSGAEAQDAEELFRKVSPSVVVIRAKGRAVDSTRGLITFSEIGSGVLISADGKVMTAAHVVHTMDEILVEGRRARKRSRRCSESEARSPLDAAPERQQEDAEQGGAQDAERDADALPGQGEGLR